MANKTGVIKRLVTDNPYEVIPRELLQDNELSFQARGLLCFLQSLPADWVIYKKWLYTQCAKNGRTSIDSAWNELVNKGYIITFKSKKGTFSYVYFFSLTPFTQQDLDLVLAQNDLSDYKCSLTCEQEECREINVSTVAENQQRENEALRCRFSAAENQHLHNTYIHNTQTNDTNESFESSDEPSSTVFTMPFFGEALNHADDTNEASDTDDANDLKHETHFKSNQEKRLHEELAKAENVDYTHIGIPKKITDALCNVCSADMTEIDTVISLLLRAKASVQNKAHCMILLEHLYEEDIDELHRVILRSFKNFKTKRSVQSMEKYLFTAFSNYFGFVVNKNGLCK